MSLNVWFPTARPHPVMKRLCRPLFALALLAGMVLLGLGSGGAAPVSAQTLFPGGCAWSGLWDTGVYGQMLLTQTAGQVNGQYAYFQPGYGLIQGQINATVQGSTLTGNWSQSPTYIGQDSGVFTFTMTQNCSQFLGRWRYSATPNGLWDSVWNGTYQPTTSGT